MAGNSGHVLVVDDYLPSRLKLALGVKQQGHTVAEASGGAEALATLAGSDFDLVLLDIEMPEVDGYEVLRRMKTDPRLRRVPVIIVSAHDEIERIVEGIELGAEDYLPKSFDPVLLKARMGACLEKKRLRDQEQELFFQIQQKQEEADRLLRNILPDAIAQRLKSGEGLIAEGFDDVSVMFVDIVDSVPLSANMPAADLVYLLNTIFSSFDTLADRYGLEKIKTSGDSYLVVGNLPLPRDGHLEAIANMALDVLAESARFVRYDGGPLRFRIGIHCGAVTAGVIGIKKFAYDLWGETVNLASRMESSSLPNTIQTTACVYERLKGTFTFQPRGEIEVKGKGAMQTFLLTGR